MKNVKKNVKKTAFVPFLTKKKDQKYKKYLKTAAKLSAGAFAISAISAIGIVVSALIWSRGYNLSEDGYLF